jgi:hypothetical protein
MKHTCVICGQEMKPWPGGNGYGNNPDPWPSPTVARLLIEHAEDQYRCCDTCNDTVVIPMRMSMLNMR